MVPQFVDKIPKTIPSKKAPSKPPSRNIPTFRPKKKTPKTAPSYPIGGKDVLSAAEIIRGQKGNRPTLGNFTIEVPLWTSSAKVGRS